MANYNILNLSERNYASEMIVGQANGAGVTQVHPTKGVIFTKALAIERGRLVGMKSDGKVYKASAEAGAGQVMATGWNFQECANGQAIDVMKAELELDLGAAVSGAASGKVAYLSPTTPGEVTSTKPSTSGQLIQIVGVFITTQVIKYDVAPSSTLVP
jgi:hypothetical protein